MINILSEIHTLPHEVLLCTLDVTSLYTNISNEEVIKAISEMLALHRQPHTLPQNNYIM